MASDTAVTSMAGTHKIKIRSGDYVSYAELTLDASETNQSVMEAIRDAINNDYAVVESAAMTATDTYTGSGSFVINVNGTETTIDYDYSSGGYTYDDVIDDLVNKINSDVDGVLAEKETDSSGNVSLKITVNDKDQYITIDQSKDTGTLLDSSHLNIDVENEKSAAALAVGSVFSPVSGESKLSISAKNTGYENRLIMEDVSGSALDFVGLDSSILTNHTVTTTDTDAGFMYSATSSTDNELDAIVEFNGITVRRATNTISDLVDNLTFNLKAEMESSDTDVNITVKNNVGEIRSKIEEFISKFNDVYTYIKNNSYSGDSGRGVFTGDSTASSLLSKLRNTVMGQIEGITEGNLSYLSDIGITFNSSTGLTLSDSSKLETAIDDKPDEVAALFNSEHGVATVLYDVTDDYTSADGTITNLITSIDNNINYLNDRIDSIQERIDKSAESLRKQYHMMQEQLATLLYNQQYFNQMMGGFY
jgi:flagellar hook-associated protein 2